MKKFGHEAKENETILLVSEIIAGKNMIDNEKNLKVINDLDRPVKLRASLRTREPGDSILLSTNGIILKAEFEDVK